jgi:hypothetical protein
MMKALIYNEEHLPSSHPKWKEIYCQLISYSSESNYKDILPIMKELK